MRDRLPPICLLILCSFSFPTPDGPRKSSTHGRSAYRAYELGDRNPKSEILDKIAKVLGVRPGCLSAPAFKSCREFVYALLESENEFDYTVRNMDGIPTIVKDYDSAMGFFAELVRNWEEMCKKLDGHEITQEEYEDWKRVWDNGTWVKTDGDKSPYTENRKVALA